MKCSRFRALVPHYIDHELPQGQMDDASLHLQRCGDCAKFLGRFEEILSRCADDRVSTSDPFFYTRLTAKIDARTEYIPSGILRLKPVALAFTILLPMIFGIWLGYSYNRESREKEQLNLTMVADLNNMLSTPGYASLDDTYIYNPQ